MRRTFAAFTYREANLRVSANAIAAVRESIKRNRSLLDAYIAREPRFLHSLVPLPLGKNPPEIAVRMNRASLATGVGPMAAVAGAFAQMAGEYALDAGEYALDCARSTVLDAGEYALDCARSTVLDAGEYAIDCARNTAIDADEVIVENGGDIYLKLATPAVIGLYVKNSPLTGRLALRVLPEDTPLGICSSSGTMGHSISLGSCDLATVFSHDTALADAAATLCANMVKEEGDIAGAIDEIMKIPGILGLIVIKGERVGIGGWTPELIRNRDGGTASKVTRDPGPGWIID